jgi:hypothetical protein
MLRARPHGLSLSLPLQAAVAAGFDLAVNMHVDDATGGGLGGWRNTLNFSLRQKYGGLSYEEVVLYPIADAIKAAAASGTKVDLILQVRQGGGGGRVGGRKRLLMSRFWDRVLVGCGLLEEAVEKLSLQSG